MTKRSRFGILSIGCLSIGVIWFFLVIGLFTSKGDLPPLIDMIGKILFWGFPVCLLLIVLGIIFLILAISKK
ncbi:MAG: hypothetical protein WBL85_04095 [Sedimentisphaerales bacterium]